MIGRMKDRLASSLGARLLATLAALFAVTSVIFLSGFLWLYRSQLAQERAFATTQLSLLFQASLENAMVKRDLPGLREIIRRLGRQPQVHRVMLANPEGKIRFASRGGLLKKPIVRHELAQCGAGCAGTWPPKRPYTRLFEDELLGPTLRIVKPIFNKPVCTPCHGPLEKNPVNGVLIADFDAHNLRGKALLGAASLAGAGAFVMVLTLLAAWLFLKRAVLIPAARLTQASTRLAQGDFSARAQVASRDELGRLAQNFNTMAEKLQDQVARIRAHDAFLQSLIDAVPDGIRVIGPDYRVRLVNRAFREQTGEDAAALTGSFCYAAHGRDEPCPHSLVTCPIEGLKNDPGPMKVMHTHHNAKGGKLPVEIIAARLDDDTGGGMLVVEAIRDLSAQISVTQEQRMAEMGQLATGVAHEIHNPLASVRLGLQAMSRAASNNRPLEEILAYLGQVDEAVDQCISVTGKMLRLSMPPADRPQIVDLAEVVEDVTSLLRYEAERQKVSITLKLDHEARILATDGEMRMLVLNLVQNAFHAMPGGGELVISQRREGQMVRMDITDTGVGMDAETMRHIFDPFYSRRADEAEGTGLGLTICQAIVRRYNGRMEVASAPGEGTTFTIFLPSAEHGMRKGKT